MVSIGNQGGDVFIPNPQNRGQNGKKKKPKIQHHTLMAIERMLNFDGVFKRQDVWLQLAMCFFPARRQKDEPIY